MNNQHKKKLKVIYFLDYGTEYGGAVHTLIQQANMVRQDENEVHFFLSVHSGTAFSESYIHKIDKYGIDYEVFDFSICSQPEDIDVVNIVDNYEIIKRRVKDIEPDLLHSVQINSIAELISREMHIPHIMNIYPLDSSFFKLDYPDIFPRYMTCDSEYWGNLWHKYVGVQYRCIRTVVQSTDIEQVKTFDINKLRCIVVGSVYSLKNQLAVIEGFSIAIENGFVGILEIYGDDGNEYAGKCKRYIKEHGLEKKVIFKGFYENMEKVYAKSDILICGSIRESYPNVVSEAMSYGMLVVSTPVGGVPEIIHNDNNGYLTNGYANSYIAEALIHVRNEVECGHASTVSINAKKTSIEIHSYTRVMAELLSFYDYVIKNHKMSDNFSEYGINDLRRDFDDLIMIFKDKESVFNEAKVSSSKIWYIRAIKDIVSNHISEGRQFYIWGAGRHGRNVIDLIRVFFPTMKIKGIIDSYVEGEFCGYKIFKPDVCLRDESCIVIIGLSNGQWDVINELHNARKTYCKDYFVLAPREW